MRKWTKHIAIVLLILQCAVIFSFSTQNKKESSVGSERITNRIVRQLGGDEKSVGMRQKMKRETEVVVRKSAHLFLFTILGFLAYLSAKIYLKNKQFLWSTIFCLAYAISDEIHQALVPGRAGLVSDVLIDMAGSIIGISLLFVIIRLKRRKKI